jgi:hypothetical protein
MSSGAAPEPEVAQEMTYRTTSGTFLIYFTPRSSTSSGNLNHFSKFPDLGYFLFLNLFWEEPALLQEVNCVIKLPSHSAWNRPPIQAAHVTVTLLP